MSQCLISNDVRVDNGAWLERFFTTPDDADVGYFNEFESK